MSELVIDCRDPARLAAFWCEVPGFAELERVEGSIEIGPPGAGFGGLQPTITFSPCSSLKAGKLRLHFDVNPAGCDQDAELARLLAAGARPADIGQKGGGPSWFRICAVIAGTAVAVALIALAVAVSHSHSSQAPATSRTSASTSAPAQPATPAQRSAPATPAHAAQSSAAVLKLQQELGQLNYYEGPDDGIMGPQTIQAITYLQRDAPLPQTGQMNAATQAALTSFLTHGNNQMAG